jgi:hypothetical protein
MTPLDDMERGSYDTIDVSHKVDNYIIRRKRTLGVLTVLNVVLYVLWWVISYENFDSKVKTVFWFNVIDMLRNTIYLEMLIMALYKHREIEKSQNYVIMSYMMLNITNVILIFYPWYLYDIMDNYRISIYEIKMAGQIVISFFFLILGIINVSNDYYRIYPKKMVIVFRNIISWLFLGITFTLFGLCIYIIMLLYSTDEKIKDFLKDFNINFDGIVELKIKNLILSMVIIAGLSFNMKIIFDNIRTTNNKDIGICYSIIFFILRFVPLTVLLYYMNMLYIIPNIIITNYMSNLVIMDYFMKQ